MMIIVTQNGYQSRVFRRIDDAGKLISHIPSGPLSPIQLQRIAEHFTAVRNGQPDTPLPHPAVTLGTSLRRIGRWLLLPIFMIRTEKWLSAAQSLLEKSDATGNESYEAQMQQLAKQAARLAIQADRLGEDKIAAKISRHAVSLMARQQLGIEDHLRIVDFCWYMLGGEIAAAPLLALTQIACDQAKTHSTPETHTLAGQITEMGGDLLCGTGQFRIAEFLYLHASTHHRQGREASSRLPPITQKLEAITALASAEQFFLDPASDTRTLH